MIPNDYDLWLERQRRAMTVDELEAAIAAARWASDRAPLDRERNRRRAS